MKLEEQVTSLEIAKKLKELGVKQESLFWFERSQGSNGNFRLEQEYPFETFTTSDMKETYSAFTVSELGEMLKLFSASSATFYQKDGGFWDTLIAEDILKDLKESFGAETEADARGKMLVYLLENNLIDNKSL